MKQELNFPHINRRKLSNALEGEFIYSGQRLTCSLMSRRFSSFSISLFLSLMLVIIFYAGCGGAGSGGTGTGTTSGSGSGTTTGTTGTGTTSGSGTTTGTSGTGTGGGTGSSTPGPVIVVVEENHGYSSVIGNPVMPYLNNLAQQYGLATQYYANTHPSINNYFEMTAGSAQIATGPDPDNYPGPANVDNIVRHLVQAQKTWKSYAESLPSVGYTDGDSGAYVHHHNPLSYFTDVVDNATQRSNLVPFTQFASDFNAGALPNFSFVAPNVNNDAHNCPTGMSICNDNDKLSAADNWLKTNIAPMLSSAQFQKNGLLVIVFDEAEETDITHGGGHIAMVIVGPKVKAGLQSATFYQHQDLLKMIATYIGIDSNIGDAAGASTMAEFFN